MKRGVNTSRLLDDPIEAAENRRANRGKRETDLVAFI